MANVGSIDRLFRLILGAVLIAAPYFYASTMWEDSLYRWGVPVIGVIAIATALFKFCPLYKVLGIKT